MTHNGRPGVEGVTPQSPKLMPDTIVEASLWANSLYPQHLTAVNFAVGATATAIALSGERTWKQLRKARITDEQTDQLIERAANMHRAFKVDCAFDSKHRGAIPKVKDGVVHYGTTRIRAAVYAGVHNTNVLGGKYVREVLPSLTQPTGRKWLARLRLQRAVDGLFMPDEHGDPRPEGIAFNGILTAAAEGLRSEPARALSRAYRPLLVPPEDFPMSPIGRGIQKGLIDSAVKGLNFVVFQNVEAKLPEIADTTGIDIQPLQAYDLIHDHFDTVAPYWLDNPGSS